VGSLSERQLLWVDVERDEGGPPEGLAKTLGLDPRDVAALGDEPGRRPRLRRPRLRRSEERLIVTLHALEPDDGKPPKLNQREVELLAGSNLVVTVHKGRIQALERFVRELDGDSRIGALSAADLLSSLADEVIAGYFRIVELIEREIDELDQRALRALPEDDVLAAIVALRRRVSLVRRTITQHRDALAALGRPEMQVEDLIGTPWEGLGDRLERAIDAVGALRDALLGTYEVYMGRTAQRANDTMKALTVLSAVLLPAVVLAGVMGMNFKLRFFEDASNVWYVLAAMVLLAITILGVARWRHWI
jgi:magnesium transporter